MIKLVHPFAVFRRNPQRFTKAERIGLKETALARATLGFVRAKDHIRILFSQDVSKDFVRRRDAHTCVDQEQTNVRHFHRTLGQTAHTALKAVVGRVFETRRIDHSESQMAEFRVAFTQVTRHPRLVVDQRELLAYKAIEQCRLAHVRAANNGEGECHG